MPEEKVDLNLLKIMEDREALSKVEEKLNRLYYSEPRRYPFRRTERSCNGQIPKIKWIEHKGRLKVLAFSDYRTHSIEELLCFVHRLDEKPDLIVYAGDDVNRFAPLRPDQLRLYVDFNNDWEIIDVHIQVANYHGILEQYYGLLFRLPKAIANEEVAKKKFREISEFINKLWGKFREKQMLTEEDLKSLLANYPRFQLRQRDREVDIVDLETENSIAKLINHHGIFLRPKVPGLLRSRSIEPPFIKFNRIYEDEKYTYFRISDQEEPRQNFFEKLAKYAKYGLLAIIGNDDKEIDRHRIHGEKVFEIHNTWIIVGNLLIIGLEGGASDIGSTSYSEGSIRLRLELAREIAEKHGLRILIVSHSPPRGILDRSLRFGENNIGSLALRDFLEETENVSLVICGHVHRCGGKEEKLDNKVIVNVSSHDDCFSRANVAWIELNENGEVEEVRWFMLPSVIESILSNYDREEALTKLQSGCGLLRYEAELFIDAYLKHGKSLLEDLQHLAEIKFKYGFSWSNVFTLYDIGIKTVESITEEIIRRAFKEIRGSGFRKANLRRAYAKILRERERDKVYLIHPHPIPDYRQVLLIDIEYIPDKVGVLYGFLDMETGEIMQFWFDEKDKIREYLRSKSNKIFIYWGGSDMKFIRQELGFKPQKAINLLYYIQTCLVAPISSTSLKEVHRVLCGQHEDYFWKTYFYDIDGMYKCMLCNRILKNPNETDARNKLKSANMADLLAIRHVVEKIVELGNKVIQHPAKGRETEHTDKTIIPVIKRDTFNEVVNEVLKVLVKHKKQRSSDST